MNTKSITLTQPLTDIGNVVVFSRQGGVYTNFPAAGTVKAMYTAPTTPWSQCPERNMTVLSSVLSETKGRVVNPCDHTKQEIVLYDGPLSVRTVYPGYPSITMTWGVDSVIRATRIQRHRVSSDWMTSGNPYGTPNIGHGALPALSWNFPSNWESVYSTEALVAMWPGVKEQLSSLVSLIELPEIKRLMPGLKQILLSLKDKTPRIWRKLRYATWGVASAQLMYSFGLKPLVSDIEKSISAMSAVTDELKRLKRMEGRSLRSHYRRRITVPSDVSSECSSYAMVPNETVWQHKGKRTITWPNSWYSATMDYSYRLPKESRWDVLLASLDAYGIRPNAEVIWDLVPFSFVVDWVFKVGDYLERYSGRNYRPKVQINWFMHSVKEIRRVSRFYQLWHTSDPNNKSEYQEIARMNDKRYIRKAFTPSLWAASQVEGSLLNLREVILGGSLLRTLVKK